MGAITTVEAALLDECRAALGNTVRTFDSLGGAWNLDALKRALQAAPGVYVAWLGGRSAANKPDGVIAPRFGVYVVAKGAVEPARRKGTPQVIGAYDIVERIAPRLAGLVVKGYCTVKLDAIDNLFQEATFALGGTVYGLQLSAPGLDLMPVAGSEAAGGSLDDFITFDQRIELADGAPVAHDQVTLPQ
jgi:phage gp37-like protein